MSEMFRRGGGLRKEHVAPPGLDLNGNLAAINISSRWDWGTPAIKSTVTVYLILPFSATFFCLRFEISHPVLDFSAPTSLLLTTFR